MIRFLVLALMLLSSLSVAKGDDHPVCSAFAGKSCNAVADENKPFCQYCQNPEHKDDINCGNVVLTPLEYGKGAITIDDEGNIQSR